MDQGKRPTGTTRTSTRLWVAEHDGEEEAEDYRGLGLGRYWCGPTASHGASHICFFPLFSLYSPIHTASILILLRTCIYMRWGGFPGPPRPHNYRIYIQRHMEMHPIPFIRTLGLVNLKVRRSTPVVYRRSARVALGGLKKGELDEEPGMVASQFMMSSLTTRMYSYQLKLRPKK